MARAVCTIEGFVASVRTGQSQHGKDYLSISIACGKSQKDDTGQYDNSRQQWWSLTAWGEYAAAIKNAGGIHKGDAITAKVSDPVARVFHNEHTQKYEAVITATLWNFSVSKSIWFKKDNFRYGENATANPDVLSDEELAAIDAQYQNELPF